MTEYRTFGPTTLALPTADRQRSFRFYGRDGLGFATPGDPADDGVPEPLQVVVNDQLRLMLIPTGGFGWVTVGSRVAETGTVECQISVTARDRADVDALLEAARAAGGSVPGAATAQPWGYCGVFADPDGHQWMVLEEPA
ncbi:MAG: glyoxalase family protein [Mycobacterium sp.]|jgi:predicted lactoylglutathione lyase|nr:glyoxalase family protein [Mycobacterium sp.]